MPVTIPVHPSDCKRVGRVRAFFAALGAAERDNRSDAYEYAVHVAGGISDCDCDPAAITDYTSTSAPSARSLV